MASKKTARFSDASNAEKFAAAYENKLIFDHLKNRWFIYDGFVWKLDSDGGIHRKAIRLSRAITKGADAREIEKQESKVRLDAMISLAKSQSKLANTGDSWNKYPMLICCPNGTLDLENGKLLKPQASQLLTMQTNVAYDSKAPSPTRWLKFIEEIWPNQDTRDYIWRAIGYSLTGITKQQCYFALFGEGSNGKSTFNYIMNKMLGDFGHTMKFTALEHNKRGGMSNDVVEISGKRFVVASETNDRVYLNEGLIKSLTGGDDIVARQLYEKNIIFRPEMKLWLAFNHKPHVADQSPGFWRRTRLIEMLTRWSVNDGIDGLPLPDLGLEDALLAELPGIFLWAVQGCLEWQQRGLIAPSDVKLATAKYQEENHPLYDFIYSNFERDDTCWTLREDIYESYLKYCQTYHEKPRRQVEFNKLMEGLRFEKGNATKGNLRVWKGLKPVPEGLEQAGVLPIIIN